MDKIFITDSLKKLIDDHEIISFDIFDTLLLRPFVSPHDVFYYIQSIVGDNEFAKARIDAEVEAEKFYSSNNIQEITLEQIYAFIPDKFKHIYEMEMKVELSILKINPEINELYKYAVLKGKKIIAISDMYLSEDVIQQALIKNEYCQISNVYVSSSYNKSKRQGDLYSYVLDSLSISPNKVLHIGDNHTSDYIKAREKNISSFQYDKVVERFLNKNENKRIRQLWNNINKFSLEFRLSISLFIHYHAIFDVKNAKSSFWHRMGYCFAGPMVYSFAKWVNNRSEQLDSEVIALVARDGFFIKKAFEIIKPEKLYHYIYASRAIVKVVASDRQKESAYINYLKEHELKDSSIVMVDVGTCNYTTQQFLLKYNQTVHGLYWVTGSDNSNLNYQAYYKHGHYDDSDFMRVGLVEFFMSSPELPIIGFEQELNGKITISYKSDVHPDELYRQEIISNMEPGILDFIRDIHQAFGDLSIDIPPESIIAWNNIWLKDPSLLEIEEFNKIKHSSSAEHDEYESIFSLKRKTLISVSIKNIKCLLRAILRIVK